LVVGLWDTAVAPPDWVDHRRSEEREGIDGPPGANESSEPRVSRAFVSRAVYGLISVLAVLQAMELHPPSAVEGAITLFGTTLAVALVDAYADSIAEMISRQRSLSRAELYEIGREVTPVLVGAQAPTLIFILAEVGLFSVEPAIWLAQAVAILMLFGYG